MLWLKIALAISLLICFTAQESVSSSSGSDISSVARPDTGVSANSAHNASSQLRARQCVWNVAEGGWICDLKLPTMNEMIVRMHDATDGGLATETNSAWFYTNAFDTTLKVRPYSNDDFNEWALLWLRSQDPPINGYSYLSSLNQGWWTTQKEFVATNAQVFEADYGIKKAFVLPTVVVCYCQALSAAAINPDAYLFTRADAEWVSITTWNRYEQWQLTENPNVQRIWRVDPRPEKHGGEGPCAKKKLMWDRMKDEPLPQVLQCPILS